jgi:hypothetical protein
MSDLSFRIEASSKAFEILASNLYSDKISAVIRELSCNAADAHVEANKATMPFDVKIPVTASPYFVVRDYGNGLRADQIEDVFTVFFSSTKAGSKVYTGAFGLGCKSPFAVTNKFFVNSMVDGKKFYYECFRNHENVPCIKFIKEEIFSDGTGLEIIVPVNGNYEEWKQKAKKIYESFKIRPNVNCHIDYFSNSFEYKYGNNWENTEKSGAYVCMNNVRYKLDLTKLDDRIVSRNSEYRNMGISYIVPPRSIEVTPSREEVSYTESTINFLNTFIREVNDDIVKQLQIKVEACPSMLMAKILVSSLCNEIKNEYFYCENIVNPSVFSWRGIPITSTNTIVPVIACKESIEIGFMYTASKYAANKKKPLITNESFRFVEYANKNTLFILINDTKASQESIKSWINRHLKSSNKSCILFLVIKQEYANIISEYNKVDISFIRKCSDLGLQKITKTYSSKSKAISNQIQMHNFCISSCSFVSSNVEQEKDILQDLVTEDGKIYFIEYQVMDTVSTYQTYLGERRTDRFHEIATVFKFAQKFDSKFVNKTDNLLLIKDLKKNKMLLKKYASINNISFVPFLTCFNNELSNHIEQHPKFIEELFYEFFTLCLITYNGSETFQTFVDHMFPTENEKSKYEEIETNISTIKRYSNDIVKYAKYSNDIVLLQSIFIKVQQDVENKLFTDMENANKYIKNYICGNNITNFHVMIDNRSNKIKEFLELFSRITSKFSYIFLSNKEKDQKIIEYCMTGKMS